jgi:hypothetical protein
MPEKAKHLIHTRVPHNENDGDAILMLTLTMRVAKIIIVGSV